MSAAQPPMTEAGIPERSTTTDMNPAFSGVKPPTISFMTRLNIPPVGLLIFLVPMADPIIRSAAIRTVFSVKVNAIASLLKTLSRSSSGSLRMRKKKARSPVSPPLTNTDW